MIHALIPDTSRIGSLLLTEFLQYFVRNRAFALPGILLVCARAERGVYEMQANRRPAANLCKFD